jgi:hypothetical protein
MPLFCIESAQSFEECEHAARAICQIKAHDRERGHGSNDASPRRYPDPAKDGRRRLGEGTARLPAPRIATNDPRFTSVKRQDDSDRPDDQAGAQVALISSNRTVRSSHLSYARPPGFGKSARIVSAQLR